MCYLKNLILEENIDFNNWISKQEKSEQHSNLETNFLFPCIQKHMGFSWTQEQKIIMEMFQIVDKNNKILSQINKIISANSQQLEKITINYKIRSLGNLPGKQSQQDIAIQRQQKFQTSSCISQMLFGRRKYKYKLQPAHRFQEGLCKERNFSIGLKLVDKDQKQIKNCNLMTLCLAVCTSDGDWVLSNRVGEPFMKGKTEVQLYKGQALFQKLYPRDVSRIYPMGKISIVIYAKPSTIKYAAYANGQQCIKSEDIEPIIFENITIRAKKKQ